MCGALTISVVALTSAEFLAVTTPLLLSALVLLGVCVFALARSRRAD